MSVQEKLAVYGRVLCNESMKKHTTYRIGGTVDYFIYPKNELALTRILQILKEENIPYHVLGRGSNILCSDAHFHGAIINLDRTLNDFFFEEDGVLLAQAGCSIINLSVEAMKRSMSGLEFASGIPGSIGGALYMNAGAYDGQIDEVFYSATVLTEKGTIEIWTKEHMDFSYRHSILQERKAIVLEAEFQLIPGDSIKIQEKMDHLMELRCSKQPLEYPSCGSVFKRPKGHYTGALIQQAGLQGLKWGGAQISEKHAGFIVNIDHATGKDYEELIAHIQKVIDQKFGVRLEPEVRIIGRK